MKPLSILAALLPLMACAPSVADSVDRGGDRKDLQIESRGVEIKPQRLDGLILRGAVVLTANHNAFGGFSGLAIAEGRFLSVNDIGWLMIAPILDDADGLRPGTAEFVALRDSDGQVFDKSGGDAEGLAWINGGLAISFERDHRIAIAMLHGHRDIRDRAFEKLKSNSGLEALAQLPDGRLLAIAETIRDGKAPMFISDKTKIVEGALPVTGPHRVTGADIGPDGRLYVVLRHYSVLAGVSIRVHRYRLLADGFPDSATREVLAEFESISRIDNMEGIALWRDPRGKLRLVLISDNNFNAIQRTLVVDFEVDE